MASSSSTSSHKPRRRKKAEQGSLAHAAHGTLNVDRATHARKPTFPLVAFLWPAKGTVSQWVTLPLILMAAGLFRWSVALWGYSGRQRPPMYGDFEAQRHWMEITKHLPVSYWYTHDLEWWGLDYPPLTAYHSWLLGTIGAAINPNWFALFVSRGLDEPALKIFMRATVFVSEYCAYVPATVVFVRRYSRLEGVNVWEASIALVAVLMQPATILIDHGHFQYNTVMLGLAMGSMSSMLAGRHLWSCVFFVSALGFKQMSLFYAPAIFSYLLGVCLVPNLRLSRLVAVALVSMLSFVLLYVPFLIGVLYDMYRGLPAPDVPPPPLLVAALKSSSGAAGYYPILFQLAQSVHRIFPFARGLFEDKVANVWCAIHTFHKLHAYPVAILQRAALIATLAAVLPPCLILLLRPQKKLLPLALAASSWAFFLFSYQVHEKNVLLPLLPMTLLLGGKDGLLPSTRAWVGFANLLGVWTLFPLLKKDELRVPYLATTVLWAYLLGLPPTSVSAYREHIPGALGLLTKVIHINAYLAMIVWHLVEGFIAPPVNMPDLWTVANVLLGAAGFGLCYLWCLSSLVTKSCILGGHKALPQERVKSQ